MTRIEKKFLHDVSESIRIIFEDHLRDINTFEEYVNDVKTQDAVERRLIIIAEALYKLRRKGLSLQLSDQIINRRNTIAHQYDEYTPERIWESVHRELPSLKEEVNRLLSE